MRRRISPILRLAVPLAVISVCGVVLWQVGLPWSHRPTVPPQPISIRDAPLRGSLSAKVGIVQFSDFQCPFCGLLESEVIPELTERYVRTGKVLLAFRNHPLEAHHPLALQAAAAASCANRRGKFWQMHDALFRNQDHLDSSTLLGMAAAVGLDDPAFRSCLNGEGVTLARAESAQASGLGVREDPALLMGPLLAGGRVMVVAHIAGVRPLSVYTDAIDRLLDQGKR